MIRNRHRLFFGCFLFVLLFAAAGAHGAEEGGREASENAAGVFKWINFAIVAGFILWLCLKKAPAFFSQRASAISSAITSATARKAAADAQLREAEAKLLYLAKEVTELRALAERESAAEVVRLRAATESDRQKIQAAAKAEVEAAERAARLALKALAANLAVDGAESLLVRQLNPEAQEAILSSFLRSLEGRPN